MSTLEKNRTSVQAFEDAFHRRIKVKKDDAATAAVAEELFEEIRISLECPQMGAATYRNVAVGKKAMGLWNILPADSLLPLTRNALWVAILDGWLADSIGLTTEEERLFEQFICTVSVATDGMKEKILARLREKLGEDVTEQVAFAKVACLLKRVDLATADTGIITALGRMFGRYLQVKELVLCAHVLKERRDANAGLESRNIAAPYIAQATVRSLNAAQAAESMYRKLGLENGILKMLSETSFELRFTSISDLTSTPEGRETIRYTLQLLADKINNWRKQHPSASEITFKLISEVRSKPTGGNAYIATVET